METAKMFEYGRGQAVRLPKRFRFTGKEVFVQRVGQAAVLLPKDAAWQTFLDGANGFTEDVFEDGREQGFSGIRVRVGFDDRGLGEVGAGCLSF